MLLLERAQDSRTAERNTQSIKTEAHGIPGSLHPIYSICIDADSHIPYSRGYCWTLRVLPWLEPEQLGAGEMESLHSENLGHHLTSPLYIFQMDSVRHHCEGTTAWNGSRSRSHCHQSIQQNLVIYTLMPKEMASRSPVTGCRATQAYKAKQKYFHHPKTIQLSPAESSTHSPKNLP